MKLSKTKEQKIINSIREHRQLIDTMTKSGADQARVNRAWFQYQAYTQGLKDALGLDTVQQLESTVVSNRGN